MKNFHGFIFTDLASLTLPIGTFVAHIDSGIVGPNNLTKQLYEKLHLPAYFGGNWNALNECLADFGWITEIDIAILHHGLPELNEIDLKNYLRVLSRCISHWQANKLKRVQVYFPSDCRSQVERVIIKF